MDLEKKDKNHKDMWRESKREALELADEDRLRQVEALEAQVASLREELDNRPVQVVTENLDVEVVREAHQKAESAYRSRDTAFRRLTQIHLLHFEQRSGRCRCGTDIDNCDVAAIVDSYPALKTWERVHFERRQRRQRHMLPRDHPGIVDARWDPDQDARSEFDTYDDTWDWDADQPR